MRLKKWMLSTSAKSKSHKAQEKTVSHSSAGVSAQNNPHCLAPAASPAGFQASIKAKALVGSQTSHEGVSRLSKSYLLPGPPHKYARTMSRRIRVTLTPFKMSNSICRRKQLEVRREDAELMYLNTAHQIFELGMAGYYQQHTERGGNLFLYNFSLGRQPGL